MRKSPYQIRKGIPEDITAVYELIRELAIVEKAEHELINTPEQLSEDTFGKNPAFDFFVAAKGDEVVGLALFYVAYSTWKGKFLYLEDLVVTEAHRGKGLGRRLIDTLVEEAHRQGANRVGWQVLDWNEPAIKFYEQLGSVLDGEWINCKVWVKEYREKFLS